MQEEHKPEKEVEIETVSVDIPTPDMQQPDNTHDDAVAELDALKVEFNELNDKYLRSVADWKTRVAAPLWTQNHARAIAQCL